MVTSATEEDPKKKSQSQLVKLDKALKLAERWVNNMSKSSLEDKSTSMELEGRPAGLGIGATVPKESRVLFSSNPVERKLLSKLNAEKSKASKRDESVVASNTKDGNAEDSEEDESESKTRAFSKKRPLSLTSPLNARKKHR